MTTASTVGVDALITGLARCGVTATVNGPVVTFTVEACTGPLAGQQIQTGIGMDEAPMWPAAPPHWVHLPTTITISPTNTNPTDTLPGWQRHSRQILNWGSATDPAQEWLAHVRSVLGQASP